MSQQPYQYGPYGPYGPYGHPYQQQPYGTSPYGPPVPPPRRDRRTAAWIAGTVVTVLTAIVVALAMTGGSKSGPEGVEVSRALYESTDRTWPLTVDTATLNCTGARDLPVATVTAPNGTTYGLNGLAMLDWPRVDPIWAVPEDGLVPRVSIADLLSEALNLCRATG